MELAEILNIVLDAMRSTNLAREPADQLEVSALAPVFGPGSRLDSIGLVALLIDIEEALASRGMNVTLSDARAVSRSRSPFRDVPSLVQHISNVLSSGV